MSATLKATYNLHILSDRPGIVRRIGAALRAAYSGRHAAKTIATDADGDTRTAEGWLDGYVPPRSPELIALMVANENLEQQILDLVRELREKHACPPPTF